MLISAGLEKIYKFFPENGLTGKKMAILALEVLNMSKRKTNGISAKGYYIALILCAVAIGVSGYLFYRHTNNKQNISDQPSVPGDISQQQDVEAVATDPAPTTGKPADPTNPTEPPKGKLKTASPIDGETVYGYAMDCLSYNQTTRDWRVHDGVDIAAEAGAPVCAAADGEVYTVYEDDCLGMTVVIRHQDGYVTKYASLAEDVVVKAGDTVTCGKTIGYVGNSALLESAVGDHVHFSVTCNDETVDPATFLEQE